MHKVGEIKPDEGRVALETSIYHKKKLGEAYPRGTQHW